MARTNVTCGTDSSGGWTTVNPILAAGEIGLEVDTGRVKVGDGATAWASLAYNVVGLTTTDTLTNKTLTTPVINSATGLGQPQYAVVSSIVTHTQQNTAMSNVTGLSFAIGASATEIWLVELYLEITAANITVDYKFGWTFPTSCTMRWGAAGAANLGGYGAVATGTTPIAMSVQTDTPAGGSGNLTFGVSFAGKVYGGGTSGTVQLQFAQNTSNASDLSVLAGSSMRYTKLVA